MFKDTRDFMDALRASVDVLAVRAGEFVSPGQPLLTLINPDDLWVRVGTWNVWDLKVGRFEAGQKAAASHTGAMAASDTAFDAAFEKAGILRAEAAEQMFDWARALEACPLPAGRGMAVLTNAGGPGVIAADALEVNGLALAALGPKTQQSLAAILPPAASIHNPVDMLASASPQQYAACLRLLLEDEGVHGLMVILPPPPMFKAEDVAGELVPVIQAARMQENIVPVLAKQARQLGFKGQMAGGSAIATPKFNETAGADVSEGMFATAPYLTNDLNDMTRAFAAKYKARWNSDPEVHGANTYDGTQMLLMAMEKAAPNITGEAIAAAFHTIKDYKGLQGTFNVQSNGETIDKTQLGVWKGGKLVPYTGQ